MLWWGTDPLTLVLNAEGSAKVVYGVAFCNHFGYIAYRLNLWQRYWLKD